MFAVLPSSSDFIFPDDATFWDIENEAFEDALDWSVQLNGMMVSIFRISENETWKKIAQVFS